MLLLYVLLFLTAIYIMVRRRSTKEDSGKVCPGPRGLPIVGNTFQFEEETMFLKLSEWAAKFGNIFQIRILGQRIILLNTIELVGKAMTGDTRLIFAGRQSSFHGEYVLHRNESIAFTNDFDLGSRMREAFIKGMQTYGEGIKEFEDIALNENASLLKKMKRYEGRDFSPNDMINVSLANIISILLIGKPINDTEVADDVFWTYANADNDLLGVKLLLVTSVVPALRFIPSKFRRSYLKTKKAEAIVKRLIVQMKETFIRDKTRGLVDVMYQSQLDDLASGSDVLFTDQRILNNFMDTIAAGMLTSSATLTSILLCLIHDQECQERVYQDILRVIGPDTLSTLEQRNAMPYIKAVVYESLRYAPPAPLALPHQCNADVNFEGYRIKEGDQVVMNIWHILHDEKTYEDPYVFRPERFLDEHGQLLSPLHPRRKSWIPFGMGPRQCIGDSLARSRIFLLICTLFQRYRFLPPKDGSLVNSDPRTYETGVVHHPHKFKCRVI